MQKMYTLKLVSCDGISDIMTDVSKDDIGGGSVTVG